MKIGIEAQRLFRPQKYGMDMVALGLIKSLHALDSTNEYHIFVKKDVDSSCLELNKKNFHLHVLPSMPYPIWEQLYLPFYIRRLKLDVLHCTANTAPLFAPCKKIVTLHDIIFLEENPLQKGTLYQKLGNLYRSWIVPMMIRSSQLLITVSYFEQKNIKRYFGFGDDKVRVVHNGVADIFFSPPSQEEIMSLKARYKLPEFYMFFPGNKNPRKNLLNVIRAYNEYIKKQENPWDLVVLHYDKKSLEAVIESEGLDPRLLEKISSLGYVKGEDLPLIIRGSQTFVYPSLREGFGIPILEGMACGVPVITSTTSSMPEVAGDAALLVDPTSVQEITNAMLRMHNDLPLRQINKKNGLARSKQFSWASVAEKSLGIYQEFKRTALP